MKGLRLVLRQVSNCIEKEKIDDKHKRKVRAKQIKKEDIYMNVQC